MSHLITLLFVLVMAVSPALAHEGHNEAFSGGQTTTTTTTSTQAITVDPEGQRAIGIQVQTVGTGSLDKTLSTTGQVQPADNRALDLNPPVQGVVRQVNFKQGDWVRAGQVMALIHSPEIAQTMSNLLQERARIQAEIANTRTQAQRDITVQSNQVELTRANFQREQTLLNEGITARRDFLEAQTAYRTAQAELSATKRQSAQQIMLLERQLALTTSAVKSQLRAMGLPAASVDRAVAIWGVTAQIPIVAPASGFVTFRDITLGETVPTDKRIFSITNLSPIWVVLNVFQEQIPQIHMGQKVRITTPANQSVQGEISYIGTVVDPNQRTLPVRVVSGNLGNLLKPGMFVKSEIITGQAEGKRIVIPAAALVEANGQTLVYVKEGNAFQPVVVRVGQRTSSEVEILDGLFAGDQVVIRGAKQLSAQRMLAGGGVATADEHAHEEQNNTMPLLMGILIGLGIAVLSLLAWFLMQRRSKRPRRQP